MFTELIRWPIECGVYGANGNKCLLNGLLVLNATAIQWQVGDTALVLAAENGHLQCVSLLIANGADVSIANKVIIICPAVALLP